MQRLSSIPAVLLCAVSAVQAWAAVPCFAPTGDWILGSDLAAAVPALVGLPPNLKVSYAPVPGLARVFHPDELRRLARAHNLTDPGLTTNVCAAWPLAPLTLETVRSAMEKALAGHTPQIEVVTQSKADAPVGELVFPLSGLSAYSENAVVWKGYVLYTAARRFDTWVSVRVRVNETHLKAQGAIRAGEKLTAGRWRAESYSGPPVRDQVLSDASQVAGLVARRDFADGAPLLGNFFETPKAVERGDTVAVSAGVGSAQIEAPGEALGSGGYGEVIVVRNPRSNRTFKARITAAGKVEVLPGTSAGLAGSETASGNLL
jgi:flagella basal body P-ring formation protein FlgA